MFRRITTLSEVYSINLAELEVNKYWNTSNEKELKIHRIHAYPAKFPAFITNKVLSLTGTYFKRPELIADIFCGCGTVAFEAKRNNIDFWGCDINPVATLIARTKSNSYNIDKLTDYYENIMIIYNKLGDYPVNYEQANERLKYWFAKNEYINLFRLKMAIEQVVPINSKYYLFFMCAFSNILKKTSRWLTKSIKPQLDPYKKPADVIQSFKEQFRFMVTAVIETKILARSKTKIVTGNFLDSKIKKPKVDMIITSPPYVTSYEYADLHQLSSLWLGYTDDYRKLREGSIGSLHHSFKLDKVIISLNATGQSIVNKLLEKDKSQAGAVAKYFWDIQLTIKECERMLHKDGLAIFVIGDTEYKGVRIENSRHVSEALLESGFQEVLVTKRRISGKILTPYRDRLGRFSSVSTNKKIYHEEYVIIGRK